jgi:hypothetical protein
MEPGGSEWMDGRGSATVKVALSSPNFLSEFATGQVRKNSAADRRGENAISGN